MYGVVFGSWCMHGLCGLCHVCGVVCRLGCVRGMIYRLQNVGCGLCGVACIFFDVCGIVCGLFV